MSMWTLHGGTGVLETAGLLPATAQVGPQFTTGIDTKGAWVQITTGLAYPSAGIHLLFEQMSAGAQRFVFELGVGAAGSEVVVLPDMLYLGTSQGAQFIALGLPAGIPISVRGQSTGAAINVRCGFWAMPEGPGLLGMRRWTTYGVTVASATAGTLVDAGAVANTMSAWVQLAAPLTNPIRLLHILMAADVPTGNTSTFGFVEIGVGSAGNEVVRVPTVAFRLLAAATAGWALGPFPVNIPAGARLAVRHQANSILVPSGRAMHWGVLAGG